MMRKTLRKFSTAVLLCASLTGVSQANMWTWMHGSDTIEEPGNYGTIGVAAPTNSPGARFGSASWTDSNGDLWLFGGAGHGATVGMGSLNDLWKYEVATNQWTWKKGSNSTDMNGVYSGFIPSNNGPGARYGGVTWKDSNGMLWLFGGYGFPASGGSGYLNDLWRYNPSTNSWSWVNGSNLINQNGVYGTLGVSNSANVPGGREGAIGWIDNSNNLWLFSGAGYGAAGGMGRLGDLWKYDPVTNEWTWMSGPNTTNQQGVYGVQGTSAPSNMPGCRTNATAFVNNNNLWLFGGVGYATSATMGALDDLWKYDITTNEWTWVKGSNIISTTATYGTLGTFASANTPGARQLSIGWNTGNEFWLFGGASGAFDKNDLWKYNIALNQWAWMKGSSMGNQPGIYGTQNTPALTNEPGAREAIVSWTDASGNLWLFGGYGFITTIDGLLNDLWKFVPCQAPSAPANVTPSLNLIVCHGTQANLSATGTGTVSWYNTPSGGTAIGTGTAFTTASLTAVSSASTVTFYAEDFTCSASNVRTAVSVTVNPLPVVNVSSTSSLLCTGQTATLTASGANTFSWNPAASGNTIAVSPTVTSTYSATGTDTNGCTSTTSFTQAVSPCTDIEQLTDADSFFKVYPNPFSDKLFIGSQKTNKLEIFNSLGSLVYSGAIDKNITEIDLSSLPKGIYFAKFTSGSDEKTKKLIKQ